MKIAMKIAGLAALALAFAAPALAQTSPSGGIGSLTPPPSQTSDQTPGAPTGRPAPATNPDDRSRPVQAPSSSSSQQ
jgi:hypothetical protein